VKSQRRQWSQLIVPSHLRPPHGWLPAAPAAPSGAWYIDGLTQSHWFASDAVVDGAGHVTSVTDWSGTENLVQIVGPQPVHMGVWAPDGQPCLEFYDSIMSADGWSVRASGIRIPFTTIALQNFYNVSTSYSTVTGLSFSGGAPLHLSARAWNGPVGFESFRSVNGLTTNGSKWVIAPFVDTEMAVAGVYTGSNFKVFQNGVSLAPLTLDTACVVNDNATFDQFRVGAWGAGTNYMRGQLCEIHVYLGELSDVQVGDVSADMIARRGI
jgi:hypothetical protein